jgi:FkbM family methyltransferase
MNLVFDIGYNHGEFSRAVLEKYKGCKIIALEANESLYLQQVGSIPEVTLINSLVSNEDNTEKAFYINHQDGISTASEDFTQNSRFARGSKYVFNTGGWNGAVQVKTITLDSILSKYGDPDLIKIDVEGYEETVIAGLTKKVPLLCFEFHEEFTLDGIACLDHLHSIGFSEFGMVGFFDEGDVFDNLTYSSEGDPYMTKPERFMCLHDMKETLRLFNPQRRINYGMMYAR